MTTAETVRSGDEGGVQNMTGHAADNSGIESPTQTPEPLPGSLPERTTPSIASMAAGVAANGQPDRVSETPNPSINGGSTSTSSNMRSKPDIAAKSLPAVPGSSGVGAGAASGAAASAIAAAVAAEKLRYNELKSQLHASQERALQLEAEMADFSSRLMDEANTKVSAANKEAAGFAKRNQALERQIEERDILVDGQRQQLDVLKEMIAMGDRANAALSFPSSGGEDLQDQKSLVRNVDMNDSADLAAALDFARWTSPLRPVARQDSFEFQEFFLFVQQCIAERETREKEKDELANATPSPSPFWAHAFSPGTSSPGPEGAGGSTPTSAAAAGGSTSTSGRSWRLGRRSAGTALTSHKFVSRTITEEVEPTLRLDQAPHISWLNRRAWLASVLDGSLIIEPVGTAERRWIHRPSYPCVLCGETREDRQYAREHVVRIPKETQSFAVGNECVMRLRFACDYLSFLRNIHEGLRKFDTAQAIASVWNESLMLREQMFWARMGGFYAMTDPSARTSRWSRVADVSPASLEPTTPQIGTILAAEPQERTGPQAEPEHERDIETQSDMELEDNAERERNSTSSSSPPLYSAPNSPTLEAQQ